MEQKEKEYYLTHLTGDANGADVFLDMPDEYLDEPIILERSYKYLSRYYINQGESLAKKLISYIGGDKEKILKIFDIDSELHYARIIKYLSDELKNDKDIIIPACKVYPWGFKDAGETIRNDREVIKTLVTYNWEIMKYVPDKYLFDDELLDIAYRQNPNILHDLGIG